MPDTCTQCGGLTLAAPEPLNLRPEEAFRHFRAKGLHAGFSWLDTDAASHLRSFTVAKAMQLDVLQDIRTEVDRAIGEGITFQQFQADLEPKLRKHGWWGKQKMLDPVTGKLRTVQLGSPKRLRTIFDTNLRMSYARGHWERISRTARARPWLRYVAVQDANTREQHAAWHGTILRWDHPFWQTHYPPNGWTCRCMVQQMSQRDLDRLGFTPSDGPPPGWDQTRKWRNARTGEVSEVPDGIDRGFAHNVGTRSPHRADSERLIQKIEAAPEPLQRQAVGQPWTGPLFRQHAAGEFDGAEWPIAIARQGPARVVRLSQATALRHNRASPNARISPADYAIVQRAIDDGDWRPDPSTGDQIGQVTVGDINWQVIIGRDSDGHLHLLSLRRIFGT